MAFNEQLCGDSFEIEFSTYIYVRSWMEVVDTNINDVNVTFAVNAKNLTVTNVQVPYGEDVEIDHPCGGGEKITVNNVMLNVARLNGYIGYYVGAELLYTDQTKVTIDNEGSNNPAYISKLVTASDICIIDNVDFLILNPDETGTIDIAVKVTDIDIDSCFNNDTGDKVYPVSGKFIITRAESTASETTETPEVPTETP